MENKQDAAMSKVMPLVMKLMNAGGWDVVNDALKAKDPARPLGMFLAQLIMKIAKAFQEKKVDLDMTVFLKDNGVVMKILDLIETHFDMPKEFSDEIFGEVITVIENMVKEEQGQGQAPQPGQAPPAPQGQPMQQGLEQGPPQGAM